jgi:hypothetical protein
MYVCPEHPQGRLLTRPSLPAGYHTGKFSFDMFTHLRSTLDNPSLFVSFRWLGWTLSDFSFPSTERLLGSRYPPYDVSLHTVDDG